METAAMVDQIINTTALSFIFSIDELILERLTTSVTRHIIGNLCDYPLFDPCEHEDDSDEDVIQRYIAHELAPRWRISDIPKLTRIFPRRLLWCVLLSIFFIGEYYYSSCNRREDGSWVSKEMYLPQKSHL